MKASTSRGLFKDKRSAKWMAIAAGLLILVLAVSSWAADPQKISRTAVIMMAFRAIGAQNPDPKTRNPDYLAAKIANWDFLYKKARWSLDFPAMIKRFNQKNNRTFYYIIARTKHIDAQLRQALEAGAKQVVIMGAGFDSRGYRFYKDFPKVKFIEVDLPVMSAAKKKTMKRKLANMPNNVVYAPINFDTQELGQVLAKVGYQKDQKTFFIWEGVVMYLEPAAVKGTLRFIAQNSAPGSAVVFDYVSPSVIDRTTKDKYAKHVADYVASLGEPFKCGIEPGKCGAFLKEQGLQEASNVDRDYMEKSYLIGSNGKPFGNMAGFFWLVTAKVPGAQQ